MCVLDKDVIKVVASRASSSSSIDSCVSTVCSCQ